jgi:hypothetical protein
MKNTTKGNMVPPRKIERSNATISVLSPGRIQKQYEPMIATRSEDKNMDINFKFFLF